jgi:hypothetical protein
MTTTPPPVGKGVRAHPGVIKDRPTLPGLPTPKRTSALPTRLDDNQAAPLATWAVAQSVARACIPRGLSENGPTALAATEYLLLSKRTKQVFETDAGTAWKPSNLPP